MLGLLGAVFYTATPGSAKYNALGEPLVFLMFGPGYVLGAYLIQTGQLSWNAVWVSIPVGFIVTAILQANDTRDLADDRESRIRTASIIFGATGARAFLSALYFAPYIAIVLLAALRIVPWTALVALITLPLALQLHKLFWSERAEKSEKLLGFGGEHGQAAHGVWDALQPGDPRRRLDLVALAAPIVGANLVFAPLAVG